MPAVADGLRPRELTTLAGGGAMAQRGGPWRLPGYAMTDGRAASRKWRHARCRRAGRRASPALDRVRIRPGGGERHPHRARGAVGGVVVSVERSRGRSCRATRWWAADGAAAHACSSSPTLAAWSSTSTIAWTRGTATIGWSTKRAWSPGSPTPGMRTRCSGSRRDARVSAGAMVGTQPVAVKPARTDRPEAMAARQPPATSSR